MKQTVHPRHTEQLLGHEIPMELLRMSYDKGIMHHAWMISGQRAIGKATFVYDFIKYSFANDNYEGNLAKLQNDSHPDILVIESIEKDISVEQVRKIHEFAYLKPLYLPYKYIVIDAIDDISLNGANALLKILEEPPEGTILFLIAHNIDLVPETIRSRCHILHLKEPLLEHQKEIVRKACPDISEEMLNSYLAFSNSRPGICISFYFEERIKGYQDLLEILANMPYINMVQINDFTEKLYKGDDHLGFEVFEYYYTFIVRKLILFLVDKKEVGQEVFSGEHKIYEELSQKTTLDNVIFVAESTEIMVHSVAEKHLDRRQAVYVLLETLAQCFF